MVSLQVVSYGSALEFIDAIRAYDSGALNFSLGSLLDHLDATQAQSQNQQDEEKQVLLAVFKGTDLLITLTKNSSDFSWMMSMPDTDYSVGQSDVSAATDLLTRSLADMVAPDFFDKVIGPDTAVYSFIEAWIAVMETKGIYLKKLDPFLISRRCYATLRTLPPPLPASPDSIISLAEPSDIEPLIPQVLEFSRDSPNSMTPESARTKLTNAIPQQKIWVFRTKDEIAGYIFIGRNTPRTIAIRNVFVHPAHRRKGVAEAMVRATTRYYLGAEPLGFEGGPGTPPIEGVKEQICLNVADPGAARVYKRCGFMLDDDARDPVTGQLGWQPFIWQGVERIDKES